MENNFSRRKFIKNAATATAAVGVTPLILKACASPSDKVTIALIGCRSMGFSNLESFLKQDNVECMALCDVDSRVLEEKAARVEEITSAEGKTGKRPKTYNDFRKVLDDRDIDAVIIGTPDHWHAIMMMYALEAGKHVYVEKPMGHSIEECNTMVAAQKKYPKLKVQVGMWQRSSRHWFEASEVVNSGILGDVHLVKAWVYKGYDNPYPVIADSEAPGWVDYDMWLGPAPKRPFNKNRFHYNFRWWWDYAGGAMTDWGVHLLDFALFAMETDMPESVTPGGGIFYHEKGAIETPDIQQAIYKYPKHALVWECGLNPGIGPYGKSHGVAFIGNEGTLIVDRNGWQIFPEMNDSEKKSYFEKKQQENYADGLDQHVQNFLECIRQGGALNAPVEVGAKTAIISEMGNIAYRSGQRIHWDDSKKLFREDTANDFLKLNYSSNWQLPKV